MSFSVYIGVFLLGLWDVSRLGEDAKIRLGDKIRDLSDICSKCYILFPYLCSSQWFTSPGT